MNRRHVVAAVLVVLLAGAALIAGAATEWVAVGDGYAPRTVGDDAPAQPEPPKADCPHGSCALPGDQQLIAASESPVGPDKPSEPKDHACC